MTRGQEVFSIDFVQNSKSPKLKNINQDNLIIIDPNSDELKAHDDFFSNLKKKG